MKKLLRFMLIVFVYSVLYMVSNAVLPFSQAFKDMNANPDPLSAVFLLIVSAFSSYAIYYIATRSSWRGAKRIAGIVLAVFLISSFMTQIETLFFGAAFKALTKADVVFIMLAPLPSIVAATLLSVKFFGLRYETPKAEPLPRASLIKRIAALGVVYVAMYFLFGYFVAWQFEELRIFYSGSAEDAGFIGQLMNNEPVIYPFQFLRGVLFASFTIPLLSMLRGNRRIFVTSVCLVYLTTAIVLVIPNPLFPDIVRWGHFIEMLSSMLLFGIITGYVLFKPFNKGRS